MGMIVNGAIRDVSLDWEPLGGATGYQWQLDDDNDFSSVPAGFEGNTTASSIKLSALEPATTYHWRVRAYKPVLSLWSEKWSFTTSLGGDIVAPSLESPQAGAVGVPIRPLFQWSAIAGADGYELMVSSNYDFDNPEIGRLGEYALPGNTWHSDVSLLYEATYYWKVRAISPSTNSAWSAVGIFTTEAEQTVTVVVEPPLTITLPAPVAPVVPTTAVIVSSPEVTIGSPVVTTEVSITTQPPTQLQSQPPPATPDWVYYMMGGMAVVIALLIVTVLLLAIKRR